MNELNYTTLRNALNQLPVHEPPAMLWDDIETALKPTLNLPQYHPAPEIWQHIETALDRDATTQNNQQTWKITFGLKQLAAAAAVALTIAATIFFQQINTTTGQIAVRQEKVDDTILKTLHEPENDAFNMVQTLCQEQRPICQQPEFQQLKSELDELTAAKIELKSALGDYGNDPNLLVEMVKIERERSKILEQIVSMI